ncbi:MAG: AAA family ATPase [Terriglobales bacterium]
MTSKLLYARGAKGWDAATRALLDVATDTRDISTVTVIADANGKEIFLQDYLAPTYNDEYAGLRKEDDSWKKRFVRFEFLDTQEEVTLANQKHAWSLITFLKNAKKDPATPIIRNLVVPFPGDESDLKYLPEVRRACPWVNVYVYWSNLEAGDEGLHELTTVGESIDLYDSTEPVVVTKNLWDGMRLPFGKLVAFVGESDEGKSPVTMDILARLSRGLAWPGNEPNALGPRSSILMNIEDEYLTDTKPRIIAAGGDPSKVLCVRGKKMADGDQFARKMLALDTDIGILSKLARSTKDLAAIVIDPITNYCGKARIVEEDKIRQVLTPLTQLAEELQIVVIIVAHLNKSSEKGQTPLQRIMGAAAFKGVARRVYFFGPNREAPESDTKKYEHIIAAGRSEKIEAWCYRTVSVMHGMEVRQPGGEVARQEVPVIKIEWTGRSKATAEDAVNPISQAEATATEKAAVELKNYLKAGKRSADECHSYLLTLGFDLKKLNAGRVRQKSGAFHEQKDKQSWWFLPTAQQTFEVPAARRDEDVPRF